MKWVMIFMLTLTGLSLSQPARADRLPACKVMDPELQGAFVGQCDGWGVANGYASAAGSASYVGQFKDGKKHGYGVKTWNNGEQYVGQFINDAKSGFGIYKWAPKGSAYPGDLRAGTRDVYIGEFLLDQRNGNGVYEWASGDVYRGQWEKDKFVSTPTPMMQMQARHEKALAEAVKKPGTTVCQVIQEGTARASYLQGTVTAVEGDALLVHLQLVPENLHNHFKAGQTIKSNFKNWEPCLPNTPNIAHSQPADRIATESEPPFVVDTALPTHDEKRD